MFKTPSAQISLKPLSRGTKTRQTKPVETQLRPGQQELISIRSHILLLPPSGCSSGVESSSLSLPPVVGADCPDFGLSHMSRTFVFVGHANSALLTKFPV